jgi:ubiquitin C-terminal hydrolase
MNSSLQCLSHIIPLTAYFLSTRYTNDLNKQSKDGTGGKLAEEYASLMQDLWFDHQVAVSPAALKMQLGKIRPEYAGFQQHDAHELVELILDKVSIIFEVLFSNYSVHMFTFFIIQLPFKCICYITFYTHNKSFSFY